MSPASAQKTMLDELRSHSKVDCDTLDDQVAQSLGPFVDCTSNQVIALAELQKSKHAGLVHASIKQAKELQSTYVSVMLEELAVEIMMVNLSARITPHLTGYAHIQTNPAHSYSTDLTIADGKRIVSLYSTLCPEFPANRVCIKIPSTPEGLRACRVLERDGIATLATTLFSMEQAAMAAHVGCTYIAPYINGLKVHFDPDYVDNDKGFTLSRSAQRYYKRIGARTQVLPASLTSITEVMQLAGADHITVSPQLLAELASTPSVSSNESSESWFLREGIEDESNSTYTELLEDGWKYRLAFTLSKDGGNEKKLTDAIVIFAKMQKDLEDLARRNL